MPEKPKPANRKAKSPPPATAAKKSAKPAERKSSDSKSIRSKLINSKSTGSEATDNGFYLQVAGLTVEISKQKPKTTAGVNHFASFAAARQAALDALVDAIETAEARLEKVKRATSIDELRT